MVPSKMYTGTQDVSDIKIAVENLRQ